MKFTTKTEIAAIRRMADLNVYGEPIALCEREYFHIWKRGERLELAVDFYGARTAGQPDCFYDIDQFGAEMLVLSTTQITSDAFVTLYRAARTLLRGDEIGCDGREISMQSWVESAPLRRSALPTGGLQ